MPSRMPNTEVGGLPAEIFPIRTGPFFLYYIYIYIWKSTFARIGLSFSIHFFSWSPAPSLEHRLFLFFQPTNDAHRKKKKNLREHWDTSRHRDPCRGSSPIRPRTRTAERKCPATDLGKQKQKHCFVFARLAWKTNKKLQKAPAPQPPLLIQGQKIFFFERSNHRFDFFFISVCFFFWDGGQAAKVQKKKRKT